MTEEGQQVYPFRWKSEDIRIIATEEKAEEVMEVLRERIKEDSSDGKPEMERPNSDKEELASELKRIRLLIENITAETEEDSFNGYLNDIRALGMEGEE